MSEKLAADICKKIDIENIRDYAKYSISWRTPSDDGVFCSFNGFKRKR